MALWGPLILCISGHSSMESRGADLLDVPGQPHSGEVPPAQLTDHMISPIEQISNLHMMISTCPKKDIRKYTQKCSLIIEYRVCVFTWSWTAAGFETKSIILHINKHTAVLEEHFGLPHNLTLNQVLLYFICLPDGLRHTQTHLISEGKVILRFVPLQ